jgi:hypothetical protein
LVLPFSAAIHRKFRPWPTHADSERTIDELGIIEAHHPAGPRSRDDVRQGEARERNVAARSGRRPAQRRPEAVARVLHDLELVAVGDLADAVPVGAVPDQVGGEDRLRARADGTLDRVDVDLVRVAFDVDEHRCEPGAREWRDVGRERHGRGDDLVTGLETEQLHREVERGRTRVHHDAAGLAERFGDEALHLAHLLADAKRSGPTPQDCEDRLDLGLVVDAARVLDPACAS